MYYTLCPTIFLLVVLRSGRRLPITCQPLGSPSGRVVPVQNTQVSYPYPTFLRRCRRRRVRCKLSSSVPLCYRCRRFRCSLSSSIVPYCRSRRIRCAFPISPSLSGSHYPQMLTSLTLG